MQPVGGYVYVSLSLCLCLCACVYVTVCIGRRAAGRRQPVGGCVAIHQASSARVLSPPDAIVRDAMHSVRPCKPFMIHIACGARSDHLPTAGRAVSVLCRAVAMLPLGGAVLCRAVLASAVLCCVVMFGYTVYGYGVRNSVPDVVRCCILWSRYVTSMSRGNTLTCALCCALCSAVLCCAVLCSAVLCSAVTCCAVLCCALCCIITVHELCATPWSVLSLFTGPCSVCVILWSSYYYFVPAHHASQRSGIDHSQSRIRIDDR